MKTRIQPSDIVLGIPLKFDIVGEDDRLLLSCGQSVNLEDSRLHLIETAFKLASGERHSSAHLSVFVRLERLAERLAVVEDDIAERRELADWPGRIRALTRELIEAADEDHDAAFAVMHLEIRHKYDVVHHMMAALVCARLGAAIGLSADERFSLVAGAITHDIAVLAMRPELEASETLSDEQRERIKAHPANGKRMLEELGIDDELWLRVVLEHHEYLDGSGYAGLSAEQQGHPTRILALADAISAMLRPRPYRERFLAKVALADLYADPQCRYDHRLVTLLVIQLGLFPPGSVLRLANREMAIAIRTRRGSPAKPEIAAVADGAGRPYYRVASRNSAAPETAIVDLLPPERIAKVRQLLPSCWKTP